MNKTMIDRLKTNSGFILAEVTLAILMISIALVAIVGMFTQAIQADSMAKDYTIAANLAQKQLELLKTQPPKYWAEQTLPAVIPWIDQGQLPSARYMLTTKAMATGEDSLIEVTVIVTWQERGIERTIQFATLYRAL